MFILEHFSFLMFLVQPVKSSFQSVVFMQFV